MIIISTGTYRCGVLELCVIDGKALRDNGKRSNEQNLTAGCEPDTIAGQSTEVQGVNFN